MSSVEQIKANQANARPVTPEGKALSSANSTKLGLYAKQAVLLTEADHQEFQALVSAYEYELSPGTAVERTFFTQLVLACWNIQRANSLEAELATAEGVDPLLSENKTFHRIAAARNRAERTFHKSLKELRAAQAAQHPAKPIVKNEPKYAPQAQSSYRMTEPKPHQVLTVERLELEYGRLQNEPNTNSQHAG